jgi:hypothetical protein
VSTEGLPQIKIANCKNRSLLTLLFWPAGP